MAESSVERRVKSLERQGQKSSKFLRLCLLAETGMFFARIAYLTSLECGRSEDCIRSCNGQMHWAKALTPWKSWRRKWLMKKLYIQRQEVTETNKITTALQQAVEPSRTQVTVLQQQFDQLKEYDRCLKDSSRKWSNSWNRSNMTMLWLLWH